MKRVPIWAVILFLLLLVNLGWMSFNFYKAAAITEVAKRFKIESLNTNGATGYGIVEKKSGQPLWVEWDFNNDGTMDQEKYFFQGKEVFEVTLSTNNPPKFSVYFHGPGKSVTWWIDDKGKGSFTDRIYYDTDGNFYKREVWYNEAWQKVEKREDKNGITINGTWHQIHLDTNGMWKIVDASGLVPEIKIN